MDNIPDGNCVGPGDCITYNICYNANGYGDTNVVIVDNLPPELEFVSATGDYEYISGTVTWNIGTLGSDESGCVTLAVKVKCPQPGGTITNCCEMTGDCMTSAITACEETSVCSPILTKKDNIRGCVVPDANITYSICYAANGYSDTNVKIIDELPTEVNYISSDPCGVYNPGDRTVTWNIGTLGPSESGCLTLIVKVTENIVPCEMFTNCCEMEGDCLHDITACEDTRMCWGVIYVDADANGNNDGTSWKDAYNYLQDALKDANISPGCEIRVADGNYKPDANSAHPEGTGERTATFKLINCVGVMGGYAGFGEPDPNAWGIKQYETILSGDLAGNDSEVVDPWELVGDPCRADNSYHVVTGSGTNSSAILDGFTIKGGHGPSSSYDGGGMYNENGSPKVENCTFSGNYAWYGGGMYNDGSSSPMVRNCIFRGNLGDWFAGGMYNIGSSTVTNCIFIGNRAFGVAGIYNSGSQDITNCIIRGNEYGQIEGGNVNYCNIEGGYYTGEGNIDEDPMFAEDGYHLTLSSPCIDAGTNTPPGGLPEEDIDGEERIMGCTDEPRVDMGVDEYYLADCNVMLRAHCPSPVCGAADVPLDVNLCWRPGLKADKHDVYFGTDCAAVRDANDPNIPPGRGRQDSNCYDPPNPLEFDTIYWWRIDEVNDSTIWRGDVWSFKTLPYCIVVEDFNRVYGPSYPDRLRDIWKDYWTQDEPLTCAEVWPVANPNHGLPGPNNFSMEYQFENYSYEPYYSEVRADIADLPSEIGSDWTANGVKALVLWFWGQEDNPTTEQMYVKLTDGDTTPHTGRVDYGDMDDIKEENWHKWSIDLQDFVDGYDVNLANISRITIGFGDDDGIPAASDGVVWFEDIQLCTCIYCNPPGQATNPIPTNDATCVAIDANLSWTAGANTVTQDIYFGTTNPPPLVASCVPVCITTYDTGTMDYYTCYFWRIDEKSDCGTTTGTVWSFTTIPPPPSQATNPSPANNVTCVAIDANLMWTPGANTETQDIYFGTTNPPPLVASDVPVSTTTYDPVPDMNYYTCYFWRIDEKNICGQTTTGTLWHFKTGPLNSLWPCCATCLGDVTGDGWVKADDLTALDILLDPAPGHRYCYPDPHYNACGDYNQDGCNKADDLTAIDILLDGLPGHRLQCPTCP